MPFISTKIKAAFFIIVLSTQALDAQRIVGKVLSYDSLKPVKDAHIYWNLSQGTITNQDGVFVFRAVSGETQFSVSHVGYQSQKLELSNFELDDTLEIFLQPVQLSDLLFIETSVELLSRIVSNTYSFEIAQFANIIHRDLEYIDDSLSRYKEKKGMVKLKPDFIFELRDSTDKILNKDHIFWPSFDASSGVELAKNHFLYRRPDFLTYFDEYDYQLTQVSGNQGIISFSTKQGSSESGFIYYNTAEELIVRIEVTTEATKIPAAGKLMLKMFTGLSVSFENFHTTEEVVYREKSVSPVFQKTYLRIKGKKKRVRSELLYLSHFVFVETGPDPDLFARQIDSLPLESHIRNSLQ